MKKNNISKCIKELHIALHNFHREIKNTFEVDSIIQIGKSEYEVIGHDLCWWQTNPRLKIKRTDNGKERWIYCLPHIINFENRANETVAQKNKERGMK